MYTVYCTVPIQCRVFDHRIFSLYNKNKKVSAGILYVTVWILRSIHFNCLMYILLYCSMERISETLQPSLLRFNKLNSKLLLTLIHTAFVTFVGHQCPTGWIGGWSHCPVCLVMLEHCMSLPYTVDLAQQYIFKLSEPVLAIGAHES